MVYEDRVGSTFRNSSNELQGTLLGSIFGLMAALACQRSDLAVGLVLSLWVFAVTYARGNPRTAHVGTVAAANAAIVLLGDNDPAGSVIRIEQSCIGIAILVGVSFLLWPLDTAALVMVCLQRVCMSRTALCDAVLVVVMLSRLSTRRMSCAASPWAN